MSVKKQLQELSEGDTFEVTELESGNRDNPGDKDDFKGEHKITKKSRYLTNLDRSTLQKIKEAVEVELLGKDFALETQHDGRNYDIAVGKDSVPVVHLPSGDSFFITGVET